jgi:hypothetical protein
VAEAIMDWQAIGAIGEMLAAAGVILTLVYLAAQIRQNTRSQRAENFGRALDRVATLQGRLSENAELSDILLRGAADKDALSTSERVRLTWMFYEMFSGFEFIFHQAQSGAMPDEVWRRWADTVRWWVSLAGVRQWWDAHPAPFTAEFTRFVNGQLSSGPPDAEAQARWVDYLAGGERPGNQLPGDD